MHERPCGVKIAHTSVVGRLALPFPKTCSRCGPLLASKSGSLFASAEGLTSEEGCPLHNVDTAGVSCWNPKALVSFVVSKIAKHHEPVGSWQRQRLDRELRERVSCAAARV